MTQLEQLGLLATSDVMTAPKVSPKLESVVRQNMQALDGAIQRIFSPADETHQDKARRIMGSALLDVADEELEVYLTELQHLIDGWLDMFERQAFGGETLKELLG